MYLPLRNVLYSASTIYGRQLESLRFCQGLFQEAASLDQAEIVIADIPANAGESSPAQEKASLVSLKFNG